MWCILLGQRLLPHREALDPLPSLVQLALAELEIFAPARHSGNRLFQAELAFLQGPECRIQLGERLLIGQRGVDAHSTASSTVASSRPAANKTLTAWPGRDCADSRMMLPLAASTQML